jgi:hypothetical protein
MNSQLIYLNQVMEYPNNSYVDDLLEWVSLVCAVCQRPIQNFTSSFINYEPIYCILNYYFPQTGAENFLADQQLLSLILGVSTNILTLIESGKKKMSLGNTDELPDIRIIITVLALLASRILLHNDRIEVSSFSKGYITELGRKNNPKSVQGIWSEKQPISHAKSRCNRHSTSLPSTSGSQS